MADMVIYELHIGTFTPEGTFDAATARLPELRRTWHHGHRGDADRLVSRAAQLGLRRRASLRAAAILRRPGRVSSRFVNAAHAHGIGVVLDVVYNHVGPGRKLPRPVRALLHRIYRTPWGRAVNYDGPGSDAVRRWAHDNALYWITRISRRRTATRRSAGHLRLRRRSPFSRSSPTRSTSSVDSSGAKCSSWPRVT